MSTTIQPGTDADPDVLADAVTFVWQCGYSACVRDMDEAGIALYKHLAGQAELEARRWSVRGERRTRQSFADPHPHDFQGAA